MKIFVTGATGFVGHEVLKHLSNAGHSIRILARNPRSEAVVNLTRDFSMEVHSGSILEPSSLAGGLQDVDGIIHLVGIISECGEQTFENVHTQGTKNMIEAALTAKIPRFIHMSALGTRAYAAARYHRSKWAAEEIVRESGINFTIFRPSVIYGPEDHFVNLFARIARFSPIVPVMGDGQNTMQPVPVGDVAKCFVSALREPKSGGQTYDLCGPKALSFNEVLETILEVSRRKRLKVHFPMALARMQAAIMEFIFPTLIGRPAPLSRDQLLMLQEDNVGNPQTADELFGLKPVSFREGIAAYLRRGFH